jgi:PAS domain S-box-containing protein
MQGIPNNNQPLFESSEAPNFSPGMRRKPLWIGLGLIFLIAVSILFWVVLGLNAKESEFEENLAKRLDLLAESQLQIVESMIETTIEQADRVINSELFKLYAAEVHLIEGDVSLLVSGPLTGRRDMSDEVAQLSVQLPMMKSLLTEFISFSGYLSGRVVNRNGTVFIATDASTTPLMKDQRTMVERVLKGQAAQFGPLRDTEQGLLLEAYLPIFPPEASGLDPVPVAVLLLTKNVQERLKTLGSSRLMEAGEQVRLIQKADRGYEEVVPWLPGQLKDIALPNEMEKVDLLSFSARDSIDGAQRVYSVGRYAIIPNWWIIVEADYEISREGLRSEQRSILSIAILVIIVFSIALGAFWALLIGRQERRVAQHFEQLAQEIEKQRQLLDRINNTISDYIVLKDLQGRYVYVNPSFAKAVGRKPEELVGLDNEAVFGFDTARRLEVSDQQVMTTGKSITFNELLYLRSQPHHLQISKSVLKTSEGKMTGIVSVIRDVTEVVEIQKRQEQAKAKTVEALVKAIELTDPYLAGQSRFMGRLAVEVTKAVNASDRDTATVETAANLSQIGKLFIDRNLLFKKEALTEQERLQVNEHVQHAAKILKDIDFGLPVYEAVFQMNELLNGRGYPQGLHDEQIILPAKVLCVVNSFCAMVQPRAYRAARSVDDAISILESSEGSYDQKILAALKEVVKSSIGEKILSQYN